MIVDEFTRECLAFKVGCSIRSEVVIDTLAELFAMRGVPNCIRNDNGPEFVAKSLEGWLEQLQVTTLFIAPGSPWENVYSESFNSGFRYEFSWTQEFESVCDSRRLAADWMRSYNHDRPHSSLDYMPPIEFAQALTFAPARQTGPPRPPSPPPQGQA